MARIIPSPIKEGIKNLIIVDAQDQFFEKLKGITEPEEKRKVISETFFTVFQEKAAELSQQYHIRFLGQGTIYPDRIESAQSSDKAAKIKSHHNVLLPDWLKLELVEPLKDFYKDEVREIGRRLDIDSTAIDRHPFPGPGLGVRILGELTRDKVESYQDMDCIVDRHIRKEKWYQKLWMSFPVLVPIAEFESPKLSGTIVGEATLVQKEIVRHAHAVLHRLLMENKIRYDTAQAFILPIKSVGVMGDSRTYEHPLCLRILRDGKILKIRHTVLESVSNELINQIQGINRIILDVTDHPMGWENLAVIRAIESTDAMTADWAPLSLSLLKDMAREIMQKEKSISRVAYDITQKPPGTMEWE